MKFHFKIGVVRYMAFALGQRWISDTESDLGLGTVVELDARTVTLMFAASEENRVYAQKDAPITRVVFHAGDLVESQEGWSLEVEEVQEDKGLITYHGTRQDTEEEGIALREIFLSNQIRFNKPQDKLFAGQIDRMDNFVLRYRALKNQYQQHKSPMRGLCGMRAGLIPPSAVYRPRGGSPLCSQGAAGPMRLVWARP